MAKPRCKAGDLAVIVANDDFPENVGRFVSVIRRAGASDCINLSATDVGWIIRGKQPLIGSVFDVRERDGAIVGTYIERRLEWVYEDDLLQPIRGGSRKATSTRRSKTLEVQHG